jgi:alkylated DNA repair protein (DNA oxidative demethylase)
MTFFTPSSNKENPANLGPDAVFVPDWLTLDQPEWTVGQFHEWASGPVWGRAAKVRGQEMSVRDCGSAAIPMISRPSPPTETYSKT